MDDVSVSYYLKYLFRVKYTLTSFVFFIFLWNIEEDSLRQAYDGEKAGICISMFKTFITTFINYIINVTDITNANVINI